MGFWRSAKERVASVVFRARRRRDAAWAAVAARRGGTFTVDRRWHSDKTHIDVAVADVAVRVDLHVVQAGQSAVTYTRFRCQHLLPRGPAFRVHPAGVASALATSLGFVDVEVGDGDEFDERFVVRSADADATRAAWTPRARRLMLAHLPKARVESKGRLVTLEILDAVADEAVLDAAIDVLVEIGASGAARLEPLRLVAGAELIPPTGPWDGRTVPSARIVRRGVEVTAAPSPSGVDLVLELSAGCQRELGPFEITLDGQGEAVSELPEGALGPAALHLVPTLAPARLSCDGETLRASVAWTSDVDRVSSAADFVALVALGSVAEGAYR